jgi:hypothetical protein
MSSRLHQFPRPSPSSATLAASLAKPDRAYCGLTLVLMT